VVARYRSVDSAAAFGQIDTKTEYNFTHNFTDGLYGTKQAKVAKLETSSNCQSFKPNT
jgi:hypothetical protein